MRSKVSIGIYQIRNENNCKVYIGQAVDIVGRWCVHRCQLAKGIHHSPHLQRAWIKYGEDAFSFSILEEVNILGMQKEQANKLLTSRDQWWMDNKKAANTSHGYNIAPTASSLFGYKHRPEVVEANRQRQLGKKMPPSFSQKMSERHRGSKNPIAKLSEEKVVEYRRRMAEGESGNSLAKEAGISRCTMNKVKLGETWKHVPLIENIPQGARKGSQHGMAKLSVEKVREVKRRILAGDSKNAISRELSINYSTVKDISYGAWADIEPRLPPHIRTPKCVKMP